MPHDLDKSCEEKGQCKNLKIIEVRIRSVWLGHGSVAAIGSFFTGLLTRNSITHWWVEIETESKDDWFCAQFWKPDITLTRHSNLSQVTDAGKKAAGRGGEDVNITNKYVFKPKNVTMGEVYNWMKTYNGKYDLISNNCQDFGEVFASRFTPKILSLDLGLASIGSSISHGII